MDCWKKEKQLELQALGTWHMPPIVTLIVEVQAGAWWPSGFGRLPGSPG